MRKKILLTICSLFLLSGLLGNLIPDNNLRIIINAKLGQPNDYEPTIDDLAEITDSLDASSSGIQSIVGIEYLINLEHLDLSMNYAIGVLNDFLPLENLVNLKTLKLNQNNLCTVDCSFFSGLTNLEVLELSGNHFNNINFVEPLINLKSLIISENNNDSENSFDITPISNLINLENLNLVDLNLVDISALSSLRNMKKLELEYNNIQEFSPLANLTNLTYLNIWGSEMSELDFLSELIELTYLCVRGDFTNVTPLANLINLKYLYANSIVELNDVTCLSSLEELQELHLKGEFENISFLECLSNLQCLDINGNFSDITSISALSNLKDLSLGSINLYDLTPLNSLNNLEYLAICCENLYDITPVANLEALNTLFIYSTVMTDIFPILSLNNLENLNLYNVPLSVESYLEFIPNLEANGTIVSYNNYDTIEDQIYPCYPFPLRETTMIDVDTNLQWEGSITHNEDINYEVFLGTTRDNMVSVGLGEHINGRNYCFTPDLEEDTIYWWKVKCIDNESNIVTWSGCWRFSTGETLVDNEQVEYAISTTLNQNYPNPFNPTTQFSFNLAKAGNVTLKIFNVKGQIVKSLAEGYYDSGTHTIQWNGDDNTGNKAASGIYFYRLQSTDKSIVKKALMMK